MRVTLRRMNRPMIVATPVGITFYFPLLSTFATQVSAQEASDCRAKLAKDTLELGKIVSVKTGHVSRDKGL